ncbi:argininosuccinate synthase, partial [bacterium]|nr:argininosuccinate synthase [bacterium]
MQLADLKNEKLGICVSGGLDSRTVAKRLVEAGLDVLCFTADLAQPDEKDINDIKTKMAPCGVETVIVDLKNDIAEEALNILKALATYDGGYWNSTGLGRAVTVRGLIGEMKKRGVTVLVHGATGRGNDQMRFERYTNVLAPEMKVYAPWRDPELLNQFPGRTQMAEYLQSFGIPATVGGKKKYSTDANIAGLSHEAEDL